MYKINVTEIQVYMKFREVRIWKLHMWQIENINQLENLGYFCMLRSSINAHLCEIWAAL